MVARFGWPPDVVRRQSMRDLLLIRDGFEFGTFDHAQRKGVTG